MGKISNLNSIEIEPMALSLVEEIVRLARWQVIFYALEVII